MQRLCINEPSMVNLTSYNYYNSLELFGRTPNILRRRRIMMKFLLQVVAKKINFGESSSHLSSTLSIVNMRLPTTWNPHVMEV